jgi:hypothetical protein
VVELMKKLILLLALILVPTQVLAQSVTVSPLSGPAGTPFVVTATFPSTMTNVELVLDGSPLTSPHVVKWSPMTPGTYSARLLNAVTGVASAPVSFTVTTGTLPAPTPTPTPTPNIDLSGIEAKLTAILTAVTKPTITCSVTGVGSYANGDQRLTVRCAPSGFVTGPLTVVKP